MTKTQTPLFDGAEKEPDKKRRKEPKVLDRQADALRVRHYSRSAVKAAASPPLLGEEATHPAGSWASASSMPSRA